MTARQKRFVEAYIGNGGNGAAAAREAGYSSKTAKEISSQLLDNREIRAAIDERLDRASSDRVLGERALLEFLSDVVRGAVTDTQLMTRLIGKGCSVVEKHEYTASVKDRLKACELLLKISGAFNREDQQQDVGKLFADTLEAIWQRDRSQAS